MLGLVLRRLRPARPWRLLAPLVALLGCGVPALAGALVGNPMLSGGGLGALSAALPTSLLYAFAGEPPDDGGPADDDTGGGGPGGPRRPDGGDGDGGIDWAAFDADRRTWERTPVGA